MSGPVAGIELWLVDIARAGPTLAALDETTPRLSHDERERAASLGKAGEDWRLLRVALRVLLERIVGRKLRGVPLRAGARGKPSLPWPADVEFSLSHSGRYGLIAISEDAIGVDLEHQRKVTFSADRQQAMLAAAQALAPFARPIEILQAWVRLEAWGKARGSGVGALLHDLGIRGPSWSASRSTADFGNVAADLLRREGFRLHDLRLPPGLHGALAALGEAKCSVPECSGRAQPELIRLFCPDFADVFIGVSPLRALSRLAQL